MGTKIKTNCLLLVVTFLLFQSCQEFDPTVDQDKSLEKDALTVNMCTEPIKIVCDSTKLLRDLRKHRIRRLKQEIYNQAKPNIDRRINELLNEKLDAPTPLKDLLGDLLNTYSRLKNTVRIFIKKGMIQEEEIYNASKDIIKEFEESVITPETVTLVKEYLVKSIVRTNLSQDTKNELIQRVNSVVVGTFKDFYDKTKYNEDYLFMSMILKFFRGNPCGQHGLVSNAFAMPMGKDNYVLICPGFMVTLNETPNHQERLNNVVQVLAHEISHHIDSRIYPQLYDKVSKCHENNYVSELKTNSKIEESCKKEPEKCNEINVKEHLGEIVADTWSIDALNLYLRDHALNSLEAVTLLTQSMSNFCGTRDEGIHPSGDFRIKNLMRKNPGIHEYLSCSPEETDNKPACTVDGTVKLF